AQHLAHHRRPADLRGSGPPVPVPSPAAVGDAAPAAAGARARPGVRPGPARRVQPARLAVAPTYPRRTSPPRPRVQRRRRATRTKGHLTSTRTTIRGLTTLSSVLLL